MKLEILPNGNLQMSVESYADREDLQMILNNVSDKDHEFLYQMLDYSRYLGNGWQPLLPEQVGALTEAPILTNDCSFNDDDSVSVYGDLWWFPNYEVESFAETLINRGYVIFTKAG